MKKNFQSLVISAIAITRPCKRPLGAWVTSMTVFWVERRERRSVSFCVREGLEADAAEYWSDIVDVVNLLLLLLWGNYRYKIRICCGDMKECIIYSLYIYLHLVSSMSMGSLCHNSQASSSVDP